MALDDFDAFAVLRGERFSLQGDGLVDQWADLIEAEPLRMQAPEGGRKAFALVFAGPPGPVLPQCIYRLAHPRLPAQDIFLVPVASDATGVRYQAIFS